MDIFEVIDGINARKVEVGITAQQIADISGVPKSSVDRILRKGTPNPSAQNILDIATAVGYDIMPQEVQPQDDDPYIKHIIAMYENRIMDQQREYNRVTAEKNRWIRSLSIIVAILVIGIFTILLIDITNPAAGWYRAAYQSCTGVATAVLHAISNICSNIF